MQATSNNSQSASNNSQQTMASSQPTIPISRCRSASHSDQYHSDTCRRSVSEPANKLYYNQQSAIQPASNVSQPVSWSSSQPASHPVSQLVIQPPSLPFSQRATSQPPASNHDSFLSWIDSRERGRRSRSSGELVRRQIGNGK